MALWTITFQPKRFSKEVEIGRVIITIQSNTHVKMVSALITIYGVMAPW